MKIKSLGSILKCCGFWNKWSEKKQMEATKLKLREAIKINRRVYLSKLKCLNLRWPPIRAFSWDLSWILWKLSRFQAQAQHGWKWLKYPYSPMTTKARQSDQLKNLSKNWQYGIPNCHVWAKLSGLKISWQYWVLYSSQIIF